MYYAIALYRFIEFQKSHTKNKKYDAIIQRKTTGRYCRIPFGDSRYQQYKDSTGLGIYSHLDHGDQKRRKLYRARHEQHAALDYFSPSYFSYFYLW